MKMHSIVVGYDGSPNARLALDAAIELAAEDGTVHIVTAFDAPSARDISDIVAALPDEFKAGFDLLDHQRNRLREAEGILDDSGVARKGHFVEAKPAAAILDVAHDVGADMIVVGSRGLGRGTRFIRGSVSTRIAGHARCSFMVIHDEHRTPN